MRKVLSTAMAAALILTTVLSGCSSNTGGNAGSAGTVADQTAKEASSDKEASSETKLLDPLSGDDLGTSGNCTTPRSNYIKYPLDGAEGITLKYWLPLPSNVSKNPETSDSVQLTEWAKLWQEMTGVTVEFIHPTQGSEDEEFNTLIAGGQLPDIIEWEWTSSYVGGPGAAARDGVLIYLDDYITSNGPGADLWQWLQDNPTVDKSIKDDDGHYYCFPFIRGSKYLQCTSGLMYRADLLEKAGYTGPLETVADLTAALTALKDYGISKPMVQQSMENLQSGTMNAFNIRPDMFISDTDGKVHYGYTEEGYKDWMKQMNEWVRGGLLDPDVLTCDRSTMETYIMTGEGAFCYGAGGGYMGTFLSTAAAAPDTYGADFDLRASNFPVLETGVTVKYGGASYDYATTSKASAAITADCEYPEIAAAFLNFCYSQAGHYAINFGSEGISYNMVDGEPVYTDEVMNNPDGLSAAVAMAKYGRANMSGAFMQDTGYIFQYYSTDQQKEALSIWNDETDSQSTLIPPITMTEDESKEYARLAGVIETTFKEHRAKWFTLEGDVEAEWDAYIRQMKDQGLDRMIELKQAAYDRYLNR